MLLHPQAAWTGARLVAVAPPGPRPDHGAGVDVDRDDALVEHQVGLVLEYEGGCGQFGYRVGEGDRATGAETGIDHLEGAVGADQQVLAGGDRGGGRGRFEVGLPEPAALQRDHGLAAPCLGVDDQALGRESGAVDLDGHGRGDGIAQLVAPGAGGAGRGAADRVGLTGAFGHHKRVPAIEAHGERQCEPCEVALDLGGDAVLGQ